MHELWWERKTAVETIHDLGHTPVYIETEPRVKDQAAKDRMDALLARSEGFVLLCYISAGSDNEILDNLSPIRYEFTTFRKQYPDAPCLVLRKTPDKGTPVSTSLEAWFERTKQMKNRVTVGEFKSPEELITMLEEWAKNYPPDTKTLGARPRFIIQYIGRDFIGLIAALSETVFSSFQLNIDYINHAARAGCATVYLSCSTRERLEDAEIFGQRLKEQIDKALDAELDRAEKENRLIGDLPDKKFQTSVIVDKSTPPTCQFYVELRAIDAPGQLNAVCKPILDLRFNIDEIVLKPTEQEHRRQTTISMWLSKPGDTRTDGHEDDLLKLESLLRRLVGVQSFFTKIIYRGADS